MGEEHGSGFGSGVGCAVVGGGGVVATWGLYLLVTTAINAVVEQRQATIRAHAEAAILYAQARQMDATTQAAQAMVAQGQALPWLMGAVLVLTLVVLAWLIIQQRQQQRQMQRLVLLAAMGKLTPEEVA